jgi:hypothetical protein
VWIVLPDNSEQDITVTAPASHYNAKASAQKFKSHFEVFVRQPWPNWPHDYWDPIYNPQPFGYPYVNIATRDAGHAWWRLSCDVSCDIIGRFTPADCSKFLGGTGWGYGPTDAARVIHRIPYEKEGPGSVYPGDGSQTVHKTYAIGFQGPGLIGALEHTDDLAQHPGIWNSSSHNCIHEVVNTGDDAGVALPPDRYPEFFGFDLPPDNP